MAIPAVTTAALLSAPLVVLLFVFGHMATSAPTEQCLEGCMCYMDIHKFRAINCTSFRPIQTAASSLMSDFSHVDVLNVQDVVDDSSDILLDAGLFRVFSNIKYMSLINASIFKVHSSAFKGLKRLEQLYLSNNRIHKFSPDTFSDTQKLRVLDLSQNPLRLAPTTFLISNSIEELVLASCNLTNIPPGSFKGLSNIKSIDLYGNQIQSFTFRSFPRNLKHLWLTRNNLTNLPIKAMTSLNKLISLDISENPINCTCSLMSLQDWFSSRGILFENDVICSYPSLYKGKSWKHVSENEVCIEKEGTLVSKQLEDDTTENSCESEVCDNDIVTTREDRYIYNVQADQPNTESIVEDSTKHTSNTVEDSYTTPFPPSIENNDFSDINKIESITENIQLTETDSGMNDGENLVTKHIEDTEDVVPFHDEGVAHGTDVQATTEIVKAEDELMSTTVSPIVSYDSNNTGSDIDIENRINTDLSPTLPPDQTVTNSSPTEINESTTISDPNLKSSPSETELSLFTETITLKSEEISTPPQEIITSTEGSQLRSDDVEPTTPASIHETITTEAEDEDRITVESIISVTTEGTIIIASESTTNSPTTLTLHSDEETTVESITNIDSVVTKDPIIQLEQSTPYPVPTTTTEPPVSTRTPPTLITTEENSLLPVDDDVTSSPKTETETSTTSVVTSTEDITTSSIIKSFDESTKPHLESTQHVPAETTTQESLAPSATTENINIATDSKEIFTTPALAVTTKQIELENEPDFSPANKTEATVLVGATKSWEGKMLPSTENSEQKPETIGSFIVLAGIIIVLLLLILYATTKKSKTSGKKKTPLGDTEGNMTELQDMTTLLPSSPVAVVHKTNNKYPNEEPSVTAKLLETEDHPDSNGNGFAYPQESHPETNESADKGHDSNGKSTLPRTNGTSNRPPPLELTKAKVVILPDSFPRTPIYIQKNVNS